MDSQMLGEAGMHMLQIRSLQATKALAWAKTTKDTCQKTSDASHATSILSQYAARGSTGIVPSQLALYQSGEPLQFLVKADQGRSVYVAPTKFRCAFRGVVHISYWYRPPSDGPCLYKKPTRNPTHAPTNAPSTSAPTTHPCDNGSHGRDSGPGGVCISKKKGTKDLLFGNTTWKCGCKPSYVCTSGCSVDHKGHKCTRTKAPTNLPTGTPTASPSAPEPTKAPTLVNLRYLRVAKAVLVKHLINQSDYDQVKHKWLRAVRGGHKLSPSESKYLQLSKLSQQREPQPRQQKSQKQPRQQQQSTQTQPSQRGAPRAGDGNNDSGHGSGDTAGHDHIGF